MRSKETQNSYTPALTSGQHLFSPQLLDSTGGGGGGGEKERKTIKKRRRKRGPDSPHPCA